MNYIDEKFKDCDPKETVERIRGILAKLGIEVHEKWNESGVKNCHSLVVYANSGIPSSNGKGITRELARASAYGEFIERLQSGLCFYKYQSINRQPGINLHEFAPDVKYMTMEEIIQNGDWMDYLIEAYGPNITRETIAEHCKAYACTDEDRIPVVPYYSIFEDKYVLLPVGFVEQMYTANGCCAGNSREEAWVHALSEIMERHCTLRILASGKAAPKISDDILSQFPTVSSILADIRQNDEYDVEIFDYSLDNGFPVVSARIISKKTHSYRVNVAADPVFEIAVQRTLTELFQGVNMHNITHKHKGKILAKVSDFPLSSNVINQLETGAGLFTADFFANELTCNRIASKFVDNSGKNNKELLQYMLDMYRNMGKQIYVRNLSILGFNSFKFVVPGFSETRSVWLNDFIPDYVIADEAAKIMRNPKAATDEDLSWMLNYSNMIQGVVGRYHLFNRISGIPLAGGLNYLLAGVTRAYAAYRLGLHLDAIKYMEACMGALSESDQEYFQCVNRYLELKTSKVDEKLIRSIIFKFFTNSCASKLYALLDAGKTPYDDYLVSCEFTQCEKCRYQEKCSFIDIKEMQKKVGAFYQNFVDGQAPSVFSI